MDKKDIVVFFLLSDLWILAIEVHFKPVAFKEGYAEGYQARINYERGKQ